MRPCERIECGSERGTEQTRTATSGKTGHLMQDLLQPLDLDCYRSALPVARSELGRLRRAKGVGNVWVATRCAANECR